MESTEPNFDDNGVDLDVLDHYLAMTPTERLEAHHKLMRFIFEVWRQNGIEPDFECEYA